MNHLQTKPYLVAALYHFVDWPDVAVLQTPILARMRQDGIRGTLLLAEEGINGTIAGTAKALHGFIDWLKLFIEVPSLAVKYATAVQQPFFRTKVKLKREIVTMGVSDINLSRHAGDYVAPEDWNALITDPSVTVIDTRNAYEVAIGSFKGAVNPDTESFREFPAYVKRYLDPDQHHRVAMFCTGGIRCEKSTAYLKKQGFKEVYHLQGGILKYFEEVAPSDSLWQGHCFVFDGRVAVDHQLQAGAYQQCHACRHPITAEQQLLPSYRPGVSCCYCEDGVSVERRSRFAERHKQLQLAQARGEAHLGEEAQAVAKQRYHVKVGGKAQQRRDSKVTA